MNNTAPRVTDVRANEQADAVFVYRIDRRDRIVDVDEAWLAFARQNGAGHLDLSTVRGCSIWDSIDDADTRMIYELMFDAVRNKQMTLTVRFRCDSPTLRRFMSLTCSPNADGGITLCSRIVREEPRPRVSVLDSRMPRSEGVIKLCAWCKRCEVGPLDWREIEKAIGEISAFEEDLPPIVSHGMCPDCHLERLKEMHQCAHTDEP